MRRGCRTRSLFIGVERSYKNIRTSSDTVYHQSAGPGSARGRLGVRLRSFSMRHLFAIALSLSLLGSLFGQARRVDDSTLRSAAKAASDGDWLTYGLTPGETRFSPLKMIDAS